MKINRDITGLIVKVAFFAFLLVTFLFAHKANLTVLCQILAVVIVISFFGLFKKQGH